MQSLGGEGVCAHLLHAQRPASAFIQRKICFEYVVDMHCIAYYAMVPEEEYIHLDHEQKCQVARRYLLHTNISALTLCAARNTQAGLGLHPDGVRHQRGARHSCLELHHCFPPRGLTSSPPFKVPRITANFGHCLLGLASNPTASIRKVSRGRADAAARL